MRKMQVGQAGKQLFKEWEGLRTHVYLDSGGEPTIGIGHLLTRDERASGKIWINGQPVRYANGLTEQQCWDLLDQDLDIAEAAVNDRIIVPLTQNQFDALVSFAFNIGSEAFKKSTLVRALNQGQYDQVPTQLRRWVRDNGVVVPWLVNRREKEIDLWNK